MTSRPLSIRFANKADAPTIAGFNLAMARETEDKTLDPATVRSGVASLFERPERGFYLVAELDGSVVGSLMITTEWSDWRDGVFWWIQSVYVLPAAQRRGVFSRLFRHVEALAQRDREVCGFRLYVERENKVAQSVYRSLGMGETEYKLFERPLERG